MDYACGRCKHPRSSHTDDKTWCRVGVLMYDNRPVCKCEQYVSTDAELEGQLTFTVGIGPAKAGGDMATASIQLPNNTELTMNGDLEIVAQLIKHFDGLTITYKEKQDER